MKAQNIVLISALTLVGSIPLQAQKQVQMKIVENGKVITDTTFVVNEGVDKNDVERVSRMLNKDDVYEFRRGPGSRDFSYSYRFRGMPDEKMDSLMRDFRFHFNDSAFRSFEKDSAFFRNFANRQRIHMRMHMMPPFPHERIIEKEIIMDEDQPMNDEVDDIIIERRKPGSKHMQRKEFKGDVKTYRKKLDDDTEVIIIKKNPKGKSRKGSNSDAN